MAIFQCGHCGCRENTALSGHGCYGHAESFYDWTGFEDRRGKMLCSACAPTRYKDGTPTGFGLWHNQFAREFLPMGLFRTAPNGNLEHVETGDQGFRTYVLGSSSVPLEEIK